MIGRILEPIKYNNLIISHYYDHNGIDAVFEIDTTQSTKLSNFLKANDPNGPIGFRQLSVEGLERHRLTPSASAVPHIFPPKPKTGEPIPKPKTGEPINNNFSNETTLYEEENNLQGPIANRLSRIISNNLNNNNLGTNQA